MIGTRLYKPLETEEQLKAYSQAAEWCNTTHQGMIEDKGTYYEVVSMPIPLLEDVKAAKLVELKAARDSRETLPVKYNDHLFDFDEKSYSRITAAIYALDVSGGTIHWTTNDNDTVEVSADDLRGVIASAAVRSNALHIKYREYKERVNAALNVSDVKAIQWVD